MSLHQLFCTNEAIAREVDSPFLLGSIRRIATM